MNLATSIKRNRKMQAAITKQQNQKKEASPPTRWFCVLRLRFENNTIRDAQIKIVSIRISIMVYSPFFNSCINCNISACLARIPSICMCILFTSCSHAGVVTISPLAFFHKFS